MSGESDEPTAPRPTTEIQPLPGRALTLKTRIALFVVGWLLVAIGVLGLALPGIQGILTILAGAAVLSLVSEWFYRLLRRVFRRWPRAWEKLDGWRRSLHARLQPRGPRGDD